MSEENLNQPETNTTPDSPKGAMSRRNFLKATAIGAGAVVLAALPNGIVGAQEDKGEDAESLDEKVPAIDTETGEINSELWKNISPATQIQYAFTNMRRIMNETGSEFDPSDESGFYDYLDTFYEALSSLDQYSITMETSLGSAYIYANPGDTDEPKLFFKPLTGVDLQVFLDNITSSFDIYNNGAVFNPDSEDETTRQILKQVMLNIVKRGTHITFEGNENHEPGAIKLHLNGHITEDPTVIGGREIHNLQVKSRLSMSLINQSTTRTEFIITPIDERGIPIAGKLNPQFYTYTEVPDGSKPEIDEVYEVLKTNLNFRVSAIYAQMTGVENRTVEGVMTVQRSADTLDVIFQEAGNSNTNEQ